MDFLSAFKPVHFKMSTGEDSTLWIGKDYDAELTLDFYVSLYKLTRDNYFRWMGRVSPQELASGAEQLVAKMQKLEIDINGYKSDVGDLIIPFFYHAFANAPEQVFKAYYNDARANFARAAVYIKSRETISLLHFVATIDGMQSEQLSAKNLYMEESFRLVCSLIEQPILSGNQICDVSEGSMNQDKAKLFIAQRIAWSCGHERQRAEAVLIELADKVGQLTFPGVPVSSDTNLSQSLKQKIQINSSQAWEALKKLPQENRIDYKRLENDVKLGKHSNRAEQLICARQYASNILFRSELEIFHERNVPLPTRKAFHAWISQIAGPILRERFQLS